MNFAIPNMTSVQPHIQLGNKALHSGNVVTAVEHYLAALETTPGLSKSISLNLALARKHYRNQRMSATKPYVAVCDCGLSSNAVPRINALVQMYQPLAIVEVIGCYFPGTERLTSAQYHFEVVDEAQFLNQAVQLVASHPYDVVYLSSPHAPNIFFGILYKLLWGAKVVMDWCDKYEMDMNAIHPIGMDDFFRQHGHPPNLSGIAGKNWTRLGLGLAKEFDDTVSPTALADRGQSQNLLLGSISHSTLNLSPALDKFIRLSGFKIAQLLQSGHQMISAPAAEISVPELARAQPTAVVSPMAAKSIWLAHKDLASLEKHFLFELDGLPIARIPPANQLRWSPPLEITDTLSAFSRLACLSHSLVAFDDARPVSIHRFSLVSLTIDAIWFANSRDLRIRFNTSDIRSEKTFVVRGYQHAPDNCSPLVLVGEYHLSQSTFQLVDFLLINPYLPVLITLSTTDAYLSDACLIPYPSLCVGGAHQTEVFSRNDEQPIDLPLYARNLFQEHMKLRALSDRSALGRVTVDIREATGAERVFSLDFREWLWSIFSLRIEASDACKEWHIPRLSPDLKAYWEEVFAVPNHMLGANCLDSNAPRARLGKTLVCSPDSFPTLHALTAHRAVHDIALSPSSGAYVMTHVNNANMRWLINTPSFMRNDSWLPSQSECTRHPHFSDSDVQSSDIPAKNPHPIAIVERNLTPAKPSQLVMPIAPEVCMPLVPAELPLEPANVSVIVTADGFTPHSFAAFLESLLLQSSIQLSEVILAVGQPENFHELLVVQQKYFPTGSRISPPTISMDYATRTQRATLIAQNTKDSYLLFINHPVLLHDSRTLDTFIRLLTMNNSATVGCLLIGANPEAKDKSIRALFSGLFPVRREGSLEIEYGDFDTHAMFAQDIYPVAGQCHHLFMAKNDLWRKMGGLNSERWKDTNALVDMCNRMTVRGNIHLFTTRVAAEAITPYTQNAVRPSVLSQSETRALLEQAIGIEELPA